MDKRLTYAVLTGDITGSSRVHGPQRQSLLAYMKSLFADAKGYWPRAIARQFQIYRGDSFQGVLGDPRLALRMAIFLRAGLQAGFRIDHETVFCDARIAMGVGSIEFLPDLSAEADGEAFRKSGRLLDRMSGDAMLAIETPFKDIDDEVSTELSLLDTIIEKWSSAQSETVRYALAGLNQTQMAQKLNVSVAAVGQRLKGAGLRSVETLLARFETLVDARITPVTAKAVRTKT